jgi:hypothetical protein
MLDQYVLLPAVSVNEITDAELIELIERDASLGRRASRFSAAEVRRASYRAIVAALIASR